MLGERHGLSYSPEHKIWAAMKERCYRPANNQFHNYGARGIYVCDEWRDSFMTFYRDMGPRPGPEYSIERKDNNGPYAPWNCEWIPKNRQSLNARSNVLLTVNGKTQCLAEWARQFGINKGTLQSRIYARWPVEKAIFTPPALLMPRLIPAQVIEIRRRFKSGES